jgi:hypothetical protein
MYTELYEHAEKAWLLQAEKDKIFSLLEQGKTLEQVKAILAQEDTKSGGYRQVTV